MKLQLGPYETTQINSFDILTEELTSQDRPMQTHIEWSNLESRRQSRQRMALVIVKEISR